MSYLKELKQELIDGKSTDEIVAQRVAYLKSEEYQSQLYRRIGTRTVELINGYIPDDEPVAISDFLGENEYIIDDMDILKELVEYFRANIDTGLEFLPILTKIRNISHDYAAKKTSDAPFHDIAKYLRDPRADMGKFVNQYLEFKRKTNIDLTQDEFMEYCRAYKSGVLETIDGEEAKAMRDYFSEYDKYQYSLIDSIISIKDIKGLGIGECVEVAALSQNLLSFIGLNSFMVQGYYNGEPHQFNVFEYGKGKYIIFDAATQNLKALNNAEKPEDLLNFGLQGPYKSCRDSSRTMRELAFKGKDYRNEAALDFDRLKRYRDLHYTNEEGK